MKAKARYLKKRVPQKKGQSDVNGKKSQNTKNKPVGTKKRKVVNHSNKRVKNCRKPVVRDKNGHILPGSGSNGGGRPKGSLSGARASEIRQSISRVEIERRKPEKKRNIVSWLDHLINKSYDDTSLAIAILGKVHPTLKSIEQVSVADDSLSQAEAEVIQREVRERCKTLRNR